MRKPLMALMVATLTLSACGAVRDSRLNPFNWFGQSRAEAVGAGPTNPLIPPRNRFRRPEAVYAGVPVDTIKEMAIERVAGGAIVRVKGISASQGAYEVRLEAENDGQPVKNTLTYTLKAQYPRGNRRIGAETSREVVAARFISDNDLAGVRTIRVVGARNARSSNRRF